MQMQFYLVQISTTYSIDMQQPVSIFTFSTQTHTKICNCVCLPGFLVLRPQQADSHKEPQRTLLLPTIQLACILRLYICADAAYITLELTAIGLKQELALGSSILSLELAPPKKEVTTYMNFKQ